MTNNGSLIRGSLFCTQKIGAIVAEDEFDEIAKSNPDLFGDGPEVITIRQGDVVESIPSAEFEALGTAIGECVLAGGDLTGEWRRVWAYPPLLQQAIAEGGYRWAALRCIQMKPAEAVIVLERLKLLVCLAAHTEEPELGLGISNES